MWAVQFLTPELVGVLELRLVKRRAESPTIPMESLPRVTRATAVRGSGGPRSGDIGGTRLGGPTAMC
jgi:hypothetical protein